MAIKFPPKNNKEIEDFLKTQGYTGVGAPVDNVGTHYQSTALKQYTEHQYDGSVVRAKQFDNFFRYTKKEAK